MFGTLDTEFLSTRRKISEEIVTIPLKISLNSVDFDKITKCNMGRVTGISFAFRLHYVE